MPLSPFPKPLMSSPRSVTLSLAPAFTMIPFTREASTPAVTPSQEIVIAFVIVTAPKPPGSRQFISPFAAVFEIAPAKVLQGADPGAGRLRLSGAGRKRQCGSD